MIPFARVTISYPIDAVFKEVADEISPVSGWMRYTKLP